MGGNGIHGTTILTKNNPEIKNCTNTDFVFEVIIFHRKKKISTSILKNMRTEHSPKFFKFHDTPV